jgi:CheY-like chemotaxis protein
MASLKNIKILLVDDSELVLQFLSKILSDQGFTILAAKNLPQAISYVQRSQPHVVICDFVLEGGATGFEVLTAILAVSKLPVALMTLGVLSEQDAKRVAEKNIPVFQKPKKGTQDDYIDVVKFWLKELKLI